MNGEPKTRKTICLDSSCVVCGCYVTEGVCVCSHCLRNSGLLCADLTAEDVQWLRDVSADMLKKERLHRKDTGMLQ